MTPVYTKTNLPPRTEFLLNRVPKFLLVVNIFMSIFYFAIITFWFEISNVYLFFALIIGQIFFLWQGLTFVYSIWDMSYVPKGDVTFCEPVDVYITVAGEPVEIVEDTLRGAMEMDYPKFNVYILNDGYVAKKENWKDIERLAAKYGAGCITRTIGGGAKAGNINNGLRQTKSPFVVIFDADHVPHEDFLRKTMRHFADKKVGFVQSPQYYKNYDVNDVAGGSWEQQELFFGAICKGKGRMNSVIMCGTNMVIRREAVMEVGGMCQDNIAEDFITGLLIHENGWKSVYVPEVLAEGLAPEDFLSYYKQQLRWARGALEVVLKYNPIFNPGLTLSQKIQYISSASYFLSGVIVLVNIMLPIIFFFTGIVAFKVSTMALAITFIPYIFLTLYTLQLATNFTFTFRAMSFSMSSFTIHIQALFEMLTGKKSTFAITSKTAIEGNFLKLVIPHLIYFGLTVSGITFAIFREGLSASVVTNTAWAVLNVSIFMPYMIAASPKKQSKVQSESIPAPHESVSKTQMFEVSTLA